MRAHTHNVHTHVYTYTIHTQLTATLNTHDTMQGYLCKLSFSLYIYSSTLFAAYDFFSHSCSILLPVLASQAIKHYFDLLQKTLKDNNLLNKSAQVYNIDETGMAYKQPEFGQAVQPELSRAADDIVVGAQDSTLQLQIAAASFLVTLKEKYKVTEYA